MQRIATLGAALLFAGVAMCASAQNDATKASPADQDFMKKAAQANLAEIETGKLAQSKGSTDEIKRFGEKMQKDHGKVLDDLRTLAKSKGVALPTEPDEEHKALAKKLAALSGQEFDRTYVAAVGVADHMAAKQLFEKGAGSSDPQVSAFSKKVLPDIEHHLAMGQKMEKKS